MWSEHGWEQYQLLLQLLLYLWIFRGSVGESETVVLVAKFSRADCGDGSGGSGSGTHGNDGATDAQQ